MVSHFQKYWSMNFFKLHFSKAWSSNFYKEIHLNTNRKLSIIGDISCDPDSSFNPIPIYKSPTNWAAPVVRVNASPTLDVMAIDNLPSLLPYESSVDFSKQLLPLLFDLNEPKAVCGKELKKLFEIFERGMK